MFYPSVHSRFRVFEGFVVSRFRPEVVSGTSWRGKPEVTSPFDLSTPLLYQLSVDILCLYLSIQKLFNIFVLA
jgi:hypothetical protein